MKHTVVVAMSGGVDSSVAAKLMLEQGYEVIGAFMKCFSDTKDPITGECNWRAERRMASKVCAQLNIPLITLDFEHEYQNDVIKVMIEQYKKGITPNPDVDCNNKVKFPLLINAIKTHPKLKNKDISYLVTGHYARVKKTKEGYVLLRGKDESKDQSYFLYRLKQNELAKTLFPIGEYTKEEVRKLAKKYSFPNAEKKGTTGICFVGKINVKEWLKKKIKPKKGKILDPKGNVIGTHDGIYYYTLGERIGPRHGITFEKQEDNPKLVRRWYVASKNAKKNELVVAPQGHEFLLKKIIKIKQLHLINKQRPVPKQVEVRIRHVGELLPATLDLQKKILTLKEPITGVSEGQALVIYKKNSREVLGGGVISF